MTNPTQHANTPQHFQQQPTNNPKQSTHPKNTQLIENHWTRAFSAIDLNPQPFHALANPI